MNHWKPLTVAAILTAGISFTGCSESPEVRLQRAKVALNNEKFSQALDLAQSLATEQPNNLDAVDVKARAQMRLQRLDEARGTIDKLLEMDANRIDSHKLLADWTFFKLSALLAQSSFTNDATLQTQFDQTIELGRKQAEWFEQHEPKADNGKYLRARYADAEARRLQVAMRAATQLNKVDSEGGDVLKQKNAIAQEFQAKIDQRFSEAEGHLRDVLEINPRHFDACVMYARLLTQRGAWDELWNLTQKTSQEKDIPVGVYDALVISLMRIPANTQAAAERVKVGLALQAAVVQNGRESLNYKKATAKIHMLANEPAKAQPLLEQIAKNDARDPETRFLLASSLAAQEKWPESRKVLDKLAIEYQRNGQIQLLYARVLIELRENAPAKEALRKAIEADPDNPEPRVLMGRMLFAGAGGDAARDDINKAYLSSPNDPQVISIKLQYEKAYGSPESVREVLEKVEKLTPLLDSHLSILIDGYMNLKKYDKAEAYSARLAKERPDNLDAQLKLAETQLSQGKDDQVLVTITELKKKFANSPSVDQMLGRLYLLREKHDRAVDVLAKVVAAEPRNVEARFMLARAYGALAMTDEALDQLNKIFELQPDHTQAHGLAARIYQLTGQPDKATDHLSRIDESKLDERTQPVLLAQLKLQKHDDEGAMGVCNRAIASGNQDALLRIILAGLYQRKNEKGQAESHLIGLVRSQPDNLFAFSLLTRFYTENRMFTQGIGELAKLQTLNEPASVLGQAQLLIASGKPVEALQKLKPTYDSLLSRKDRRALLVADPIALILVANGKADDANKIYENLKPIGVSVNEIEMRQIDIYLGREPVEASLKKLNDVASRAGAGQPQLRRQLLARYRKLQAYDKALTLIDTWIKTQPDEPTLHQWKADILLLANRPADAVNSFKTAAKLAPDDAGVLARLAQAQMVCLDYPAAEQTFEQMAKIDSGAKVASLALKGEMFLTLGLKRQAADVFEQLERLGRPSDPRVMLAMGQAYSVLGKSDKAVQRLSEIPTFAPQYAAGQIIIARIEQSTGKADKAKTRIEQLVANPNTNAMAIQEMTRYQLYNSKESEILRWTDQQLAVEKLPIATRVVWLRFRVGIEANRQNWEGVLSTLEQLAKIENDVSKASTTPEQKAASDVRIAQIQAAQAVVLMKLRKPELAQAAARNNTRIATGWLLALALGQNAEPPVDRAPLVAVTGAMIKGDVGAAKDAAMKLNSLRSIFRSDLSTLLDRSDATSAEMSNSFKQFALALVAQEVSLPQLAEEICQDLTSRVPDFMPAYGLQAQAMISQGKTLDPLLNKVRKAVPGTSLAEYLKVQSAITDKKYDEAAKGLASLIVREPENEHLQYEYAQALQLAKNYDQAIEQLRKIYATPGVYRLVAANDLAYLIAEYQPTKLEEASKIADEAWATARKTGVVPQFLDTVGWIAHLKGDNKTALSRLVLGLKYMNAIPEVHYHLGVVYQALGNKAWATYHLDEAANAPAPNPTAEKAKKALTGA